ncbi:nucleoprotein TPR isoform X2 [Hyalella azteca]|uniref:Nucleoprotein TPR n=1 Tax=Hyalella azteca TaxID=294128 RepID=A0A8B7PNN9_HYAAZ|nr:nucleoprotein TPR isoform X2 [Hyalella azteca]
MLEQQLQQLNTKNETLLCELKITRSETDSLTSSCNALSGTIETKNGLILDLKNQITSLEQQVSGAMRAKAEAQIQSEEAANLQRQLENKERLLSQERSMLRGQVELLQQQLEKRVQEAMLLRNEHSSKLVQLQQDLHIATTESRVLKESQEQLEKAAKESRKRVSELLETLNEARDNELKLEESFRMELSAQQKLVSIYQISSEDLKTQCDELERGVLELRSLLKEASEQYGALERAKESQAQEADAQLQKREEIIADLRDELDKVNMLLEANAKKEEENAMFSLTPAANAASQLLSKGLTLSQLYAEHLTATDKLLKAEEENANLTRYIDQILQEIEERAPALQKQRKEYIAATEMVEALQKQIDENNEASRTIRDECSELERRCKFLMREQERLVGRNADLDRQVAVLLMQVEAARAGLPPPNIDDSISGGVNGQEMVSAQLLCFRDVSELQQQNQKLLQTVRALTDQVELADTSSRDKQIKELQEQLNEAHAELEKLRISRDKIEAIVENVVRQRDTYKSLLATQGKDWSSATAPAESSAADTSRTFNAEAEARGAHARQLKEELDKVSKELETCKASLASAQQELKSTERRHQDQLKESQKHLDDLRATLDKTRSQNVKLLSHAEYNDERIKTMQGNCESFQRQVNALEEKNTTLQSIVSRHEATMDHLRGEHMTLVKKLAHAEVIANNLKEEKLIFKETEARLLAERENFSRQESTQAMVLASLASIKNNLEHKDASERMQYQNKIADLTDQNLRLKAKLEANTDLKEMTNKLAVVEERLKACERERVTKSEHLASAKEHLQTLQSRYEESLQREKQLTVQLKQLQTTGTSENNGNENTSSAGNDGSSVRDVEVQLAEERGRVAALQRALSLNKESLASLQTICAQQEKELAQSAEATQTMLKKLEEMSAEKLAVEKQLAAIEEKLQQLQETSEERIAELTRQLQQTQEDVLSSKDVVETARADLEMAKKVENDAKKIIEEAQRETLAVQQKYEREVMLHGSDLQQLAKLKEEAAHYQANLGKITAEKIAAQETLEEVQRAGNQLTDSLKRDRESLTERIKELEDQNNSLVEQFSQLSDKMASLQSKMSQDGNESIGNVSMSEEECRTSDQLREVIKYLRRERELATGRCDVAQAELSRVKAQIECAHKRAEHLAAELNQARLDQQASLDTTSRYGELLRKVHTVDALADSNRLLRQEKDDLQQRADQDRARADALAAQVEPLNIKIAETLAEVETLQVEKKALEKDIEMYKKRTQELVEKLNRAKPEDFMKMQQELAATKNALALKETDNNKLRVQVGQLQKNIRMVVTSRDGLQQQHSAIKEEKTKLMEENKKLVAERTRLVAQVGQLQERNSSLQAAQQQEQLKQLELRNQLLQQLGEVKQREEAARRESDLLKKEAEASKRLADTTNTTLEETENKNAELQKALTQLRKIAQKYKKAAESTSEEEGSSLAARVKELGETNEELRRQLEEASKTDGRDQEGASRAKLMEGEVTRLRQELEARTKETHALRSTVNKQLTDIGKKLEEANAKSQAGESRVVQLEKEKELLTGQVEALNLKVTTMQRQINLDPTAWPKQQQTGTSKPSTSVATLDKAPSESPPTANIKPLAAASPSVTLSSPRPTAVTTAPSRTIPTASIRPLAPPSSSAPSMVVVPHRDVHSEGLVSSSTALPQATVTPTPSASLPTSTATTTVTLPTSTATTATQLPIAAVAVSLVQGTTLTATVPPTPAVAAPIVPSGSSSSSVSVPVATAAVVLESAEPIEAEGETAADQFVSQAIALIAPSQEIPSAVPGPSFKRKREGEDQQCVDEDENKRTRVELETPSESLGESSEQQPQQEVGDATSSSNSLHAEARAVEASRAEDDVILVDSDDEEHRERQDSNEVEQSLPAERMEEREAEERRSLADNELPMQCEAAEVPSESHEAMQAAQQQQPSSSSPGHRQSALVLPRPSANNDRVGSSGSSDGGTASLYEDGSDASQSRFEALPEPVSSPQRGTAPPAPLSPGTDATSESGVSTSDAVGPSADSAAGTSQQQLQHSPDEMAVPSGNYPEADSVAAHDGDEEMEEEVDDEEEDVGEDDEQADEENDVSPENNRDVEEEDDVVEVPDDEEEEESSEALQQPREAVHQERDVDEVTSGGEEVSGSMGPSSSSYAAPSSSSSSITAPASPSSSSSRRITPITWDRSTPQHGEPQRGSRGQRVRGPYRSSDRILGRRQQQQAPVEVPQRGGFTTQRSVRGGQKARRSRQAHM